ncbi:similar to Saccharomyces cerevisiae YOR066W MSA1 Activator of G1-specific transcription factors, MBF and SBF [Maudiozyma saulgeensis]|uniref:Similar to Saccharomyces cerevisiae YOR066W MSA1 Activator of G1-specific transcription factors, MBF and SBF n=1 Tax=Maudiozyma saulgeensis TaxID=1789683 RepID=A0A1X7RAQ1_9SACH|nr:similar to Saccharomyces cerevisiae YOR066W MSA1 Activator of G1-specific transcription factors, MBF and SBF [Kazachstania saulgeensis]
MINNYNRNLLSTLNKEMLTRDPQSISTLSTPIKSSNNFMNGTNNHQGGMNSTSMSAEQYGGSSPFTPHSSDNLFQSVPRMNILSSPPSSAQLSSSATKPHKSNIQPSNPCTPLKLSLTIGANGKASIVSPHIFKHLPLKPVSPDVTNVNNMEDSKLKSIKKNGKQNDGADVLPEKTKILNLLKKMRSTTSSLNSSPTKNMVKKPIHKKKTIVQTAAVSNIDVAHSSPVVDTKKLRRPSITPGTPSSLSEITNKLHPLPQVTVSGTPNAPSTPRTKHAQFRTGFTPSMGLDMVLSNSMSPRMFFTNGSGNQEASLDDRILKFSSPSTTFSPKNRVLPKPTTSQSFQQQQQQQQFPFKYSGGDPLLINDVENGHWFETMNNNGGSTGVSTSNNNNQTMNNASSTLLLASPKPHITTFASPTHIERRLKPVSLNDRAKLQMEPATPNDSNLSSNVAALQFTPLIQQTMNGSLSSKMVASSITMSPIGTNERRNSMTNISDNDSLTSAENDDASLSLKKLINRS